MSTIKYVIADDHKIFRQGIRTALSVDTNLQCMGEAEDGNGLIALIEEHQPDVALVDLKMPGMDGMEATKQIHRRFPDVKVLILTMYEDEHFILYLLELGANGYLIKNADPTEIKTAMYSSVETGYYLNDFVNKILVKNLMQRNKIIPSFKTEIILTEKETEILRLICQEYSTTEIGDKLCLSARTIEGIRATLLEKIGVKNIAGLVMYAVRVGLIH